MVEYFDPSPRSSKRRKTATPPSTEPTSDAGENNTSIRIPPPQQAGRRNGRHDDFEDSAYGSKEDSFAEDRTSIPHPGTTHDTITSAIGSDVPDKGQGHSIARIKSRKEAKLSKSAGDSAQDMEDTIIVQPRSSGRERKRPRKYSLSPEPVRQRKISSTRSVETKDTKGTSGRKQPPISVDVPKGILTPSRRQRGTGPRKSVVFDQDEKSIGEQFGFKDIDETSATKASKLKLQAKGTATMNMDEVSLTPSKKAPRKRSAPASVTVDSGVDVEVVDDQLFFDHLHEIVEETVVVDETQDQISPLNAEEDPTLSKIKAIVLARLTSRDSGFVAPYLQTQYGTLQTLLQATVTSGESNSLLLLGARGTGKSHLLNSIISGLTLKHPDDFHTVRLNGFYQTDDKLALREIWRQLGREMQVDEMENGEAGNNSYADTMSSLLSLLSHPDEYSDAAGRVNYKDEDAMQVDGNEPIRTSKSIVFILDEFDLFTTHPRQTLLYNLFDIAQSKKAPIAVVGCSTRMDVVDCLEKRVKSRFSHRWLHVPSARTLNEFEDMVKHVLCVDRQSTEAIKIVKEDLETRQKWNTYVQKDFLPSPLVQDLIKRTFYSTKSLPDLLAALYIPIAALQLPSSSGRSEAKSETMLPVGTTSPPSVVSLLPSLPTLHLALLIAASRLDTIHNLTILNFNLVYAHYVELISRSKLQMTASGAVAVGASLRQWTRDTARSVWEDLGTYDCIVPASGANMVSSTGAGSRDGPSSIGNSIGGEGANIRMWRVDVNLEELDWAMKVKWQESGGVRDVLSKWCRDI